MLTTPQKTGLNISQVSTFFRPPCLILSVQEPQARPGAVMEMWRAEAQAFQPGCRPPLHPPFPLLPKERPAGLPWIEAGL